MKERGRPKVGRMARLKGQVERLVVDNMALVNAKVAEKTGKNASRETQSARAVE
ncbi:MAG: hypothetical protein J2P48_12025 [Alphaproteobacteria bacterium]|nr:hypothetical protein [Alphaproteobacteria bacterium]